MLDQVWGAFGIQPDIDLAVMTQDQSLAAVTVRIMEGLDPVIQQTKTGLDPSARRHDDGALRLLISGVLPPREILDISRPACGRGTKFRTVPRRDEPPRGRCKWPTCTLCRRSSARDVLLREGHAPADDLMLPATR